MYKRLFSPADGATTRRTTTGAPLRGSPTGLSLPIGIATTGGATGRLGGTSVASPDRRIRFPNVQVRSFVTHGIDRTAKLTSDPGGLVIAVVFPHESDLFSGPRTTAANAATTSGFARVSLTSGRAPSGFPCSHIELLV